MWQLHSFTVCKQSPVDWLQAKRERTLPRAGSVCDFVRPPRLIPRFFGWHAPLGHAARRTINAALDCTLSRDPDGDVSVATVILRISYLVDVTNLNAFIDEDPTLEGKTAEEIMLITDGTVFNNAAQVRVVWEAGGGWRRHIFYDLFVLLISFIDCVPRATGFCSQRLPELTVCISHIPSLPFCILIFVQQVKSTSGCCSTRCFTQPFCTVRVLELSKSAIPSAEYRKQSISARLPHAVSHIQGVQSQLLLVLALSPRGW